MFKEIAFVKCKLKVSRLAVWRGKQMHYGYVGLSTAVFICCVW